MTVSIVTGETNAGSGDDILLVRNIGTPGDVHGNDGNDVIAAGHSAAFLDPGLSNNNLANALNIDTTANWSGVFDPLTGATTAPHTTVGSSGLGAFDYYSVTLAAGATITLDMDFGGGSYGSPVWDPIVKLLDSTGTIVASADDADATLGGLGSVPFAANQATSRDPYMTYTVATAGTYYVQVGAFVSGQGFAGVPNGSSYLLNVSATDHASSFSSGFQAGAHLFGDAGDDYLVGTALADVLRGGLDDDQLFGMAGDDTLIGDDANEGHDVLDGGDGNDTADYRFSAGGVTVSLAIAGEQDTGSAGTDTLRNIENLSGGAFNDTLTGDGGANQLAGGDGNDKLYGGGGDDILRPGSGSDQAYGSDGYDIVYLNSGPTWNINFLPGHLEANSGGQGYLAFTEIEEIHAAFGNDTITMAAGITAYGEAGDDLFYGALGMTKVDGGEGNDTLDTSLVGTAGQALFFDIGTGASSMGVLAGIENLNTGITDDTVNGTNGNDQISTNGGSDQIGGREGDDILNGGAGNDLLIGGAGNDTLIGGDGFDTASWYTSPNGVVVSLAVTTAQFTGDGTDQLFGIEALTGSFFADTLTGNAGANTLDGGDGNDRLDGGAGADKLYGGSGDDVFVVDDIGDKVYENAFEGDDTVESSVSFSLAGQYVETLKLTGTADISGTGNALANLIVGNDGANRLNGGAGADQMRGGLGNDRYFIDDVGDIAFEEEGEGTDTVESSVSYSAENTSIEIVRLTGSAATDATGNASANTLIGNSNANTLNGLGGADDMRGGKGDDTYWVDTVGDTVTELDGEGSDTVNASVSFSLAGQYVEVLNLLGSAAINGIGNSLNNRIVGNDAANILNGGAGNDRLDGGAGADRMIGGLGNDVFVIDNAGDVIVENDGEGTDTVEASFSYSIAGQYIEILTLTGSANINATGNGLANTLNGNAGNNLLNGGIGADTMRGGAGDDTYIVDDAGDHVFENAGEGTDTVQASVSFSINGQYVENLVLTGTAAINGTGNSLANILTGNAAANLLSGGAGDDALHGGLGGDTLTGGAGQDSYWFETALGAGNVDTITDFSAADDTIMLDRTIFTGIASDGALSGDAFWQGTAAHDADDRIVYDKATGNIYYDADGNGAGTAVLFAHVAANTALTSADFFAVP